MLKHSNKKILQAAAIVSKEHHEKYNGNGYPMWLKRRRYPYLCKNHSIADVFDALGSDRVYKKKWDDKDIFQYLKEERGEHFDPKLIDIFFENIDEILAFRDAHQD